MFLLQQSRGGSSEVWSLKTRSVHSATLGWYSIERSCYYRPGTVENMVAPLQRSLYWYLVHYPFPLRRITHRATNQALDQHHSANLVTKKANPFTIIALHLDYLLYLDPVVALNFRERRTTELAGNCCVCLWIHHHKTNTTDNHKTNNAYLHTAFMISFKLQIPVLPVDYRFQRIVLGIGELK